MIGEAISHYRILSKLGAGGMGEVYLAQDTSELDRTVALKMLPLEVAADKDRLQRFTQEARTVSNLNHPNILTIYEFGQADSVCFIATEFIDGETLRQHFSGRRLKLADVLDIAAQIVAALNAAHEAGVVHRDIKPENVMVRRDHIVKVLDFGLAKPTEQSASRPVDSETGTKVLVHTEPGRVMGTVSYMSPEQSVGSGVDHRTDIWSAGILLYEMLAGVVPFEGKDIHRQIIAIQEQEPAPLSHHLEGVPARLEEIIVKCLAKDTDERYQTAKDLLIDLRNLKRRLDVDSEIERTVAPAFRTTSGSASRAGTQSSQPDAGATNAVPAGEVSTQSLRNAPSIAVLPFANMSADPENEYFCDGLAEELLNALAKIEDLKVAARTSAFSFKGKNANVSDIGRALGVQTVLEGSVRKSGNRVRITVQLINAANGYHLWSERYDREMQDIFDVQDEITLAVVDSLKVKLLGAEKAAVLKRYTESTEAYHLYLRGRYHWNKRTEDDFKKAITYFNQAIEIDASYALAYTGLTDSYNILGDYGFLAPKEAFPSAKAAVMKALEIDDTLAETHNSLAYARWAYDWDWVEAEREFKRAIQLNPDYATARQWYGEYLTGMGRFDEAQREIKRAEELDPLSLIINAVIGWVFYFAREFDRAIEQLQKTLEMDPNFTRAHVFLGRSFEQKLMYEEAIAEFTKAVDLSGSSPTYVAELGQTYAVAGKRVEALKILDELKERSKRTYISPYDMAIIYNGLGEKDQAFEWLQRARDDRAFYLVFLKVEPRLDGLRSDPRFADLLRRMGIPS